jgi:hypothetical protein
MEYFDITIAGEILEIISIIYRSLSPLGIIEIGPKNALWIYAKLVLFMNGYDVSMNLYEKIPNN